MQSRGQAPPPPPHPLAPLEPAALVADPPLRIAVTPILLSRSAPDLSTGSSCLAIGSGVIQTPLRMFLYGKSL
jgi:hypothetical protein